MGQNVGMEMNSLGHKQQVATHQLSPLWTSESLSTFVICLRPSLEACKK